MELLGSTLFAHSARRMKSRLLQASDFPERQLCDFRDAAEAEARTQDKENRPDTTIASITLPRLSRRRVATAHDQIRIILA